MVASQSFRTNLNKSVSATFLFLYSLLLLPTTHNFQLSTAAVSGVVLGENGEAIPGVNVRVEETGTGAATDAAGFFKIDKLTPGTYTLRFSGVGFEQQEAQLHLVQGQQLTFNVTLSEQATTTTEVLVKGVSVAQEVAVQPIAVSVVSAAPLQYQAIGVADVLRRSSGVLVRRQGGLGSNAVVNLNGLSGNAVRIYYDGLLLEYLSGGISLNNLPVGLIDRVEVYKGVMPINVGTDALGGGVNIVPRSSFNNRLQASYEVGSFNTHRATVTALHKLDRHLFVGLNAFYNYSDNDYLMRNLTNRRMETFTNRFGRTDTS